MPDITKAKILIMATDGFEQSELMVPLTKLRQAGATVHVAAPKSGEIKGWREKNWGDPVHVDRKIEDVRPGEYDALVLPGGQMNPDSLRKDKNAVKLIREFLDEGKPVAAICGPWLLVEADAVRGKTVTSWESIKTDIRNAGGNWVDREVVVDGNIITSRSPKDLDAFVASIIEHVEKRGSAASRRMAG